MKYTGPVGRIARRLGVAITPKCVKILEKRPSAPGQHGKRRRAPASDFGKQLLEKQKLRFQYLLTEKSLRQYYFKASNMKGSTGTNLLRLLDARLDATLMRAGVAPTIAAARQFINHRHVLVNGRRAAKPGLHVRLDDFVSLTAKAATNAVINRALDSNTIPLPYMDLDRSNNVVRRLREPERNEIPVICEEQLVVEWYSR
jgi:small subunit ribosomal protein S4